MFAGNSYKETIDDIYGCERCSLCTARNNIVIYRGNPKSNIMIIGEAPGAQEDSQAKPMVGKSGSYLVKLLNDNGLTLYNYMITNVVLCKPPENADPTPEQMDACSKWLNMQIGLVCPEWIIAVGRIAYSRLNPRFKLNRDRITKEEGKVEEPPHLFGTKVVPIQHPSAILRSPVKVKDYEKTISGVCSLIKESGVLSGAS